MPTAPQTHGDVLAAIDIGSNSFRLEIAQIQQDRYKRGSYIKENVRLGAGLDSNGFLTDEAAQRGLACLATFAKSLEGFAASRVRAVATQTLREARNRDAFLARAQPVLGFPIEVISGREEARLIFNGVARLQPSDVPRLVVDIGGRSTEMIIGRARQAELAESFQVGSVGLSMKYFPDGEFTERAFREAQVAAGAELEEAMAPFAPARWAEAMGSSGTVGAVSQLLLANGVTDGDITPDGLRWLINKCLKAGHADRLSLPGLKEDRRAVIGGGLSVLYTIATHFGIDSLKPARGALRQGVIFDLHDRLDAGAAPYADVRNESVRQLQARFHVDLAQAARVSTLAQALFANVMPNVPQDALRELQWAAALHEVGMSLSHHDHHRHGAYIVSNADMAGFSQSQQRRLGALLLAQRGGLRKIEAALAQGETAWQVMCLRLAMIVCHARSDVSPGELVLSRQGARATLALSAPWAASHPRTLYLLREEVDVWAKGGPLTLSLA